MTHPEEDMELQDVEFSDDGIHENFTISASAAPVYPMVRPDDKEYEYSENKAIVTYEPSEDSLFDADYEEVLAVSVQFEADRIAALAAAAAAPTTVLERSMSCTLPFPLSSASALFGISSYKDDGNVSHSGTQQLLLTRCGLLYSSAPLEKYRSSEYSQQQQANDVNSAHPFATLNLKPLADLCATCESLTVFRYVDNSTQIS